MNGHYENQMARMTLGRGFVAALDQSGGSTPKALAAYGVSDNEWSTDSQMFDAVHAMRTRIMTSPSFNGERVLGAILFEDTMDRQVMGMSSGDYLWTKQVIPFVKVDAGLAPRADGVQLMNDNPALLALLERAAAKSIFGTKMRSVIHEADASGIAELVAQQFHVAKQILDSGLMPIVEPEVSIEAQDKAQAETLLLAAIEQELTELGDRQVILKLTLPETAGQYAGLCGHQNVLRVVALSGGYDLDESCLRLAQNRGTIASFSRVLTNGLSANQDQADFDTNLAATINRIFEASIT